MISVYCCITFLNQNPIYLQISKFSTKILKPPHVEYLKEPGQIVLDSDRGNLFAGPQLLLGLKELTLSLPTYSSQPNLSQ